jgi:alkanesulfonate monooxygenase SsuD/methylene tetrahydromethanopterin reductase-like flavin-dependent oxidoreductase (luciferase family)
LPDSSNGALFRQVSSLVCKRTSVTRLRKPAGGLEMLESSWVTHPWVQAGGGRPRFALHAGPYADWLQFVDLVQRAESCGFDAYWMVDHPVRRPGCWTTLAGLAAVTRRIRLGTLVNCVLYRSAFEVARQAADVDRISNGRVILGVGAGDDELECQQLGISMPPARERVRLLGQMIHSVKDLWGETNPRRAGGCRSRSVMKTPVGSTSWGRVPLASSPAMR